MIEPVQAYWIRCSAKLCNGCLRITGVFFFVEDAADVAEEEGWLVAGHGEHVCPACKKVLASGQPLADKQRLRIIA